MKKPQSMTELNILRDAAEWNRKIQDAHKTVLKSLRDIADKYNDPEAAHSKADDALILFLETIEYRDVAKAWRDIDKWYA